MVAVGMRLTRSKAERPTPPPFVMLACLLAPGCGSTLVTGHSVVTAAGVSAGQVCAVTMSSRAKPARRLVPSVVSAIGDLQHGPHGGTPGDLQVRVHILPEHHRHAVGGGPVLMRRVGVVGDLRQLARVHRYSLSLRRPSLFSQVSTILRNGLRVTSVTVGPAASVVSVAPLTTILPAVRETTVKLPLLTALVKPVATTRPPG